jgi:hypothetical protein
VGFKLSSIFLFLGTSVGIAWKFYFPGCQKTLIEGAAEWRMIKQDGKKTYMDCWMVVK